MFSHTLEKVVLLITFLVMSHVSAHENLHVRICRGDEITAHIKAITNLCRVVYKEYPYLYDGTEEEYTPFIQQYTISKNAIAYMLFDTDKLIGMTIGMPMNDVADYYQQIVLQHETLQDLRTIYYLGECVLLKEYRGKGHGRAMYLAFERLVNESGNFKTMCLCKINELDYDPLMPVAYKPLTKFWKKSGFQEQPHLHFSAVWKNSHNAEVVSHTMVYWIKELAS